MAVDVTEILPLHLGEAVPWENIYIPKASTQNIAVL